MVTMTEEPKHTVETPATPDTPAEEPTTRQIPGMHVGPPTPGGELSTEAHEALQMKVAMKMVGSAMVFIGFIQVFLSASTGAEITIFPMILYFAGMALWAHSSVKISVVRYLVIAFSTVCALGFLQLGEVLFWHKYVIYWGTIGMVVFFMFQTPKKPADSK